MPGAPPPADICTGNYFYRRSCDTFWAAAWPGGGFPVASGPGHQSQGCSAHTKIIVGSDWKSYAIIDQGPGAQGYRRPSDNGVAAALWDTCFNGPGLPTYDCANVNPPQGPQIYQMKPLSSVQPAGQRDAYKAMFGCGGPVPPVPNPFAAWIEQFYNEGISAGCGAPAAHTFCPDRPVTRQEMAVFILKAIHGANYVPPPCTGIFTDVPC